MMADEIQFQNAVDGTPINVIPNINHLVSGVSSSVVTIQAKNLSTTNAFSGVMFINPIPGRTYSNDLLISEIEGTWVNEFNVYIAPQGILTFQFKVEPSSTPPGSTGRAAISANGNWVTPV